MTTKYWKKLDPKEVDFRNDKYLKGWFRSAEPFVNELKELIIPSCKERAAHNEPVGR